MCNLGRVAFVVHEEKLEFPDVTDEELLETIGEKMAGLLVTTVANLVERVSATWMTEDR